MKKSALLKEKPHNDRFFLILMSMVWVDSILLKFIRAIAMNVPFIWSHVDLIISLAYIAVLCFSLSSVSRILYVKELLYLLLFYGVYYLHYILFPLNEIYFIAYGDKVTHEVLPMFLVGICVYRIKREQLLKYLFILSNITIYAFVIYMFVFKTMSGLEVRAGDMHAAYSILPHVCIAFCDLWRKPNPWNIAGFVLGGVFLLFMGTRGALLCLGVFVIFTILFSGRLKHPILFLSASVIVLLALFAFGLLDVLYEVAENNGFSLRIFKKLESGEITDSSGRDKIKDRVWEHIRMNPSLGLGIFSDRRVAGGHYAHHLVLELMLHYGIFMGLFILILLLRLFIRAFLYLRKEKEEYTLYFLTALLFSSGFKLFLSSSYLYEPYFFFAIGYAYAAVKERGELQSKKRPKGSVRFHTKIRRSL